MAVVDPKVSFRDLFHESPAVMVHCVKAGLLQLREMEAVMRSMQHAPERS